MTPRHRPPSPRAAALRRLALVLLAVVAGCAHSRRGGDAEVAGASQIDLLSYVDPLIGTDDSRAPKPVPGGAGGSTYPGAVVPFGMVQFSPDTPTASPSGYRDKDREIEQLSLTHFDGAGCPNNEDLPILPFVGDLTESPGGTWSNFRSGYTKRSEAASPGYYAVDLDRYLVRTELTATTRTGFARFTFPESLASHILVHAGRSATGTRAGWIEVAGKDRLQGMATAGGFCQSTGTFPLWFAIAFDKPFSSVGTWLGGELSPDSKRAEGTGVGSFVTFDTTASQTVQMKIGISYVSIANAKANLEAENPGWDFDGIRRAAEGRWGEVLHRVEVTGGRPEDLTKFYTALYHVFQSPNVASDVNGQYMGFDRKVHTADGVRYQNYSGWDIIRSWTHLVAAIAPETRDIVRSMVADGVEGGLLPFWTHENVETRVMVGDPGTVNVANAHAMGVRGFDERAALALMKKSADDVDHTQRWGLSDWLAKHFVSNAATTLEYAMADFALSKFAEALGDEAAHRTYLARSGYWRESYHPKAGFIAPRAGTPSPGANAARIYEVSVFGPATADVNLAVGGSATASGSCAADEGPERAINGKDSDKWCDKSSADKWLEIDLGAVKRVDRVVLAHAGAGGESTAWNTQDFAVAVRGENGTWTTVAAVAGNRANVTTHRFKPMSARYVRLTVTTPIRVGASGEWDCQPFDPASECGFVEGNAAQYVWMVPHDLEGLFTSMGGHAQAIDRLDGLFQELNAGMARPHFYIGNEPEHGTPWVYNFARVPSKTRAVVRRIIDEEFATNAGGLPGNDDLGATSAWLVWAYLGLYPVIPGTDVLALHGPYFPSAKLRLASGKTLTIRADDAGGASIRTVELDGVAQTKSWVRFRDLARGGTLAFGMSPNPSAWGTSPSDVPPSFPP